MHDVCIFPLCRYIAAREGFCLHHAKHYAGAIRREPAKKISVKSLKRIVQEKLYLKKVKAQAAKDDRCKIKSPVCTGIMQGFDHKQKRSPGNYLKDENLIPCCNACNLYKELEPEWAKNNGFSISRFKK